MINKKSSDKKTIEQYDHKEEKRLNNPPIGLVTAETDKDTSKKIYAYDPHIDPSLQFDSYSSEIERIIDNGLEANSIEETKEVLSELKKRREPYLNWAGKAENNTFEVPTVSLHVHERIDPLSIIESVRKKDKSKIFQPSLFENPEENPPFHQAIEFYRHPHGWSNRLIAGDSLLVMNSLLEKEGMAGKVQMIYVDPPYGIKYGSNFQPFVNKRDVKDGKDEDLTQEPETVKAFRDTWEFGVHSYLTYFHDRLLLCRELLNEYGNIFVQISDDNIHLVRCLMDEVFGKDNFVSLITFRKAAALGKIGLSGISDYLIWYSKDRKNKYHELFQKKDYGEETRYAWIEYPSGERMRYKKDIKLPVDTKFFVADKLSSAGLTPSCVYEYIYKDKVYIPPQNTSWRTNYQGIKKLDKANRLFVPSKTLTYVQYFDDFPVMK